EGGVSEKAFAEARSVTARPRPEWPWRAGKRPLAIALVMALRQFEAQGMRLHPPGRLGLSKIDVLIAAVVLLTVLGLLVASLPRAHETSDRVTCANNLKLIGESIHRFQERKKFLPASRIDLQHATWAVQIAPDLYHTAKSQPLQNWDLKKSYYDQPAVVREAQIPWFYCPARRKPPQNSSPGDPDDRGKPFPGALGDYAAAAGDGAPARPWDGPDANGPFVLGEVLERKDGLVLAWRSHTTLASLKRGQIQTALIGDRHVPMGSF